MLALNSSMVRRRYRCFTGAAIEDLVPFAEWLVGGHEDGTQLITRADELEQDTGLGLIFADVSNVIEDQQMVFVKLVDGDCDTTSGLTGTRALSGEFTWRCARGRVKGSLLLAPTRPPRIQAIELARKEP